MSRAAARDGAQRSLRRRGVRSLQAAKQCTKPDRLIPKEVGSKSARRERVYKRAAETQRGFFRSGGARQAGECHALPRGTEHSGLCDDEAGAPFEPRLIHNSKKAARLADCFFSGADDEARTRYLHLGKVALYRMSYIRMLCGFVNVYIIHTDRTVVKHYFPFFTVGITRRASKMTSDIRTSPKNSQARPNKSRAYFIFTFTVPFR